MNENQWNEWCVSAKNTQALSADDVSKAVKAIVK